jgi:hypothetical protein
MGRRAGDTSGLRQLLLEDYRRSLERWRKPGKVYEKEEALASGAPVVVGAADLMCALMHAGLPHSQYAFGGRDWNKAFLLDGDRLLELPDDR